MTFWQMVGSFSAMATILGFFLTVHAVINNRTLQEEFRSTREILSRIEQGQSEARKEVAEVRKEVAEAWKQMAEAIKYVADLIRLEGERTRDVIGSKS